MIKVVLNTVRSGLRTAVINKLQQSFFRVFIQIVDPGCLTYEFYPYKKRNPCINFSIYYNVKLCSYAPDYHEIPMAYRPDRYRFPVGRHCRCHNSIIVLLNISMMVSERLVRRESQYEIKGK